MIIFVFYHLLLSLIILSCSPSPVALLSSCLGDSWRFNNSLPAFYHKIFFIFIFNVKYSKIINKFEKLFFSEEILICSYLYLDPALSWDYQELLRIQGSDYHCRDHFHHQGHHESHIMIIMWMKAIVSFIHEPFHLLKMVKYGSRCRSEEVGSPHRHHHHHQQHHHLNGHDDHRCRSEEVGSPRGSSAGRGMSQSAAGLQVAMMMIIMIMGSR